MKKKKNTINTQKPRTQNGNDNVILEGDLTIVQAHDIRNKLSQALEEHNNLRVTVQNVTSMDLTCIQLLYAFTKTCTQINKKAILDINLDPELELLLRTCGFGFIIARA